MARILVVYGKEVAKETTSQDLPDVIADILGEDMRWFGDAMQKVISMPGEDHWQGLPVIGGAHMSVKAL